MKRAKGTKDGASWDHPKKTKSGKQVSIHFHVDNKVFEEMKFFAPMLATLEKNERGKGIKRNTPGSVAMFCVETMMKDMRELYDKTCQTTNST